MEASGQNKHKLVEFSLSDIMFYVLKFKWIIVLFAIVFSMGGYFYTIETYQPLYRATASMVVNAKQTVSITEGQKIVQSASDIYLAQELVNTYSIVLKSNRVMEYVVKDLGLKIPSEVLRTWIQLTPAKDTQVLFVSVIAYDPKLAVSIANSLMKVAPKAMMETVEIGSVNVLDEASLPDRIIPLNATQNTFIAAIIGFSLGTCVSIFSGLFFPRIKNIDDIEEKLVLQTIAEIPHVRQKIRSESLLLSTKGIGNSFFEAYSRIRTLFMFSESFREVKTIVVTSAVESEGKTSVTANIALSLASSGKKVLVIEGDLRKPKLYRKFRLNDFSVDMDKNLPNLLNGSIEFDEGIMKIGANLSVIKGSHEGKLPVISDMLASEKMKDLLLEMRKHYDYILIDTPPYLMFSDASILSNFADGVILVVRQDTASIKAVSDVTYDLKKTGANILGCVLNDIRRTDIGTRYKRKYYYNNKYVQGENLNI